MARKTCIYTETREGRDLGKSFFIEEMSASQAERWATRALSVASKSGIDLPQEMLKSGMAGFVVLGMRAFLSAPWHETQPLLDEMFACIEFIPDPKRPDIKRPLVESDIEEVTTRLALRQEVLDLHLGFFKAAVQLIRSAASTAMGQAETSSNTPTSPDQSPQPSAAA
jgi:hypothetical protein